MAATALAKLQNITGIQTFALNKANLITATVSTAGHHPSAFLRTDGTNSMLADLNVGGNNITNTRTVNAITLRANTLQDANHAGFSVDPGGTSTMNDMRTSIVYDRDNTAYYVDPAATTKLNITDTLLLRVGRQTEGGACSGSSIALDSQGKLLTCQGSVWKKGVDSIGNRLKVCAQCRYEGRLQAEVCSTSLNHWSPFFTSMHGDDNDPQECRFRLSNGEPAPAPARPSFGRRPLPHGSFGGFGGFR